VSAPDLFALLKLHEGCVDHAYQDSLGFWTIGVGHLIDVRKGGSIPPHIIDGLLSWDVEEKKRGLFLRIPWAAKLDFTRQCVLVDMAFNLGVDGLMLFRNMLTHVQCGRYEAAAEAMLDSKWATQVKTRAVRLAKMMETGVWPSIPQS
jgi:lysozyme